MSFCALTFSGVHKSMVERLVLAGLQDCPTQVPSPEDVHPLPLFPYPVPALASADICAC